MKRIREWVRKVDSRRGAVEGREKGGGEGAYRANRG
jgi:hypothetical protein